MLKALNVILEIQDLDMKMIRLMRLKQERQGELEHIDSLRTDLQQQQCIKEDEIKIFSSEIVLEEHKILDIKSHLKALDAKQSSIKKVDEFNALTKEMSTKERERIASEHKTSDLIDKKHAEEEILEKIKDSLISSEESSKAINAEITATIKKINEEGRELKEKRDLIAQTADPEILKIYTRLLNNKKDNVVVPLENRACSGCHITLTAQHENLIRKGERLVFCEHCSRILYWPENMNLEGTSVTEKKRRRRTTS
jgi:predicted  nucleic acid-binding Zn-ribbon protein